MRRALRSPVTGRRPGPARVLRIAVLAVVAAFVPVVVNAAGASAAVAGVWQYWDYPSLGGTYNTDEYLTVKASGPTRFFAHQVWFNGGDAAYLGLQDTPNGRIAIFSVWNSPGGAVAGSGANCLTFGGEGVGWSCRVPYAWTVGTKYRLRVWATASQANGSTQYIATVQNTATGVDTTIGYLWNAAGQGQLSSSVSWIEDYGTTTGSCGTETAASAVFSRPVLNAGAATAATGQSQTSTCGSHSSKITKDRAGNATLTE
jgi:hypothetical protein